jgi:ROK family
MRIGVDLGGTKIEMIALRDDGAPLLRRRVPTPARDYLGILDAVADLVTFAEQELAQKGTVGVATPGAISPKTGFIKNSNSIVLNGKPLNHDLSIKLGRPIRLENDANCFALSEAVDGAAAQAGIVFELPGIDPLGDDCNNVGAAAGPIAGRAIQVVRVEPGQDAGPMQKVVHQRVDGDQPAADLDPEDHFLGSAEQEAGQGHGEDLVRDP